MHERQEDLYRVLDETLPVIHAALVGYYRFSEAESEAFQDTLCIWFHRVTRRAGSCNAPAAELREQVLFVACKYARAFQIARLQGADVEDDVNLTLNRAPEEVAVELLGRVERTGATL
jgi:hypothetical protein